MIKLESIKAVYVNAKLIAIIFIGLILWIALIGGMIFLMNIQNPFDDEITIYIKDCLGKKCEYAKVQIKLYPESQTVLLNDEDGYIDLSDEGDCAVWDSDNWKCKNKFGDASWEYILYSETL